MLLIQNENYQFIKITNDNIVLNEVWFLEYLVNKLKNIHTTLSGIILITCELFVNTRVLDDEIG